MSLIGLQEIIEVNRADLEKAGIRGIDLDYLTDDRVDHQLAMRALEGVVANQLARCRQVRSMVTEKQWEYYEVCAPEIKEMKTWRKAKRELKTAFENQVLVFFKVAEERSRAK